MARFLALSGTEAVGPMADTEEQCWERIEQRLSPCRHKPGEPCPHCLVLVAVRALVLEVHEDACEWCRNLVGRQRLRYPVPPPIPCPERARLEARGPRRRR